MAPKAGERFSWRVVKAKTLLGQADIERLAGIALLHLDQLHACSITISIFFSHIAWLECG
jgi:hypothetical protein